MTENMWIQTKHGSFTSDHLMTILHSWYFSKTLCRVSNRKQLCEIAYNCEELCATVFVLRWIVRKCVELRGIARNYAELRGNYMVYLGVRIQLWWTLAESEEQANTSQPADLYLDFIYKLEYSGNHKTVVWLSPHSFFCYVMSLKILK